MPDKSHLLDGLILGSLIGAALAILFAPEGGEKNRELLKSKLKELELENIIERFSEAFEEGKQEADRILKEGAK